MGLVYSFFCGKVIFLSVRYGDFEFCQFLANADRFDYNRWLCVTNLVRAHRTGPSVAPKIGTESGGSTQGQSVPMQARLRQQPAKVRLQPSLLHNLEPGHQLSSDEQGADWVMQRGPESLMELVLAKQRNPAQDVVVISNQNLVVEDIVLVDESFQVVSQNDKCNPKIVGHNVAVGVNLENFIMPNSGKKKKKSPRKKPIELTSNENNLKKGLGSNQEFQVLHQHMWDHLPNNVFLLKTISNHTHMETFRVKFDFAGKLVEDKNGQILMKSFFSFKKSGGHLRSINMMNSFRKVLDDFMLGDLIWGSGVIRLHGVTAEIETLLFKLG
ncbi:hypothetical protein ACOSQ2_018507 [Xanthoceras sorbifolium]